MTTNKESWADLSVSWPIWAAVVLCVSTSLFFTARASRRMSHPPVAPAPAVVQPASLPLAQRLDAAAVLIRSDLPEGVAHGSGTVIIRHNTKGEKKVFVLTAAHVIDEATNVVVVRDIIHNGFRMGSLNLRAKVVKVSKAEDLALLQVSLSGTFNYGVEFYLDNLLPPPGTEVMHVGCFRGPVGFNSISTGVISGVGREPGGIFGEAYYDQVSCPVYPGSSGGGVFLRDGRPDRCRHRRRRRHFYFHRSRSPHPRLGGPRGSVVGHRPDGETAMTAVVFRCDRMRPD